MGLSGATFVPQAEVSSFLRGEKRENCVDAFAAQASNVVIQPIVAARSGADAQLSLPWT
jgi:hypothetical protein